MFGTNSECGIGQDSVFDCFGQSEFEVSDICAVAVRSDDQNSRLRLRRLRSSQDRWSAYTSASSKIDSARLSDASRCEALQLPFGFVIATHCTSRCAERSTTISHVSAGAGLARFALLPPARRQFPRKGQREETLFVAGDEGGDAVQLFAGAGGARGQPIHLRHNPPLFGEWCKGTGMRALSLKSNVVPVPVQAAKLLDEIVGQIQSNEIGFDQPESGCEARQSWQMHSPIECRRTASLASDRYGGRLRARPRR